MELQQMIYFKAVAECENVSRAAQKLYISQPALTKVIQRLEADLGVRLFDRTGRSIRLNDTGRIALSYTSNILEDIERMRMALHASLREKELRVFTNLPNLIRYAFPVYKLDPKHPEIQSKYEETLQFKSSVLLDNVCDIVITNVPLEDKKISNICLLRDRLLLCAPQDHPLGRRSWVRLDDLIGLSFLWANDTVNTATVRYMQRILEDHHSNITPVSVADLGSMNYLLEFTGHFTITSTLTSLFYTPPNRVEIPMSDPDAAIPYYAAFLLEQENAVAPFLQWVYDWFARMDAKIRDKFPEL